MSGNIAENWNYFRKSWNDYEIATGLREKDKKVYAATLEGIMSKDSYNIYKRLPMENEIKESFFFPIPAINKVMNQLMST